MYQLRVKFINFNKNHKNLHIVENKSIYLVSKEFWISETNEFFEGILSSCLFAEDFLLQEVIKMLKRVVVSQKEVW